VVWCRPRIFFLTSPHLIPSPFQVNTLFLLSILPAGFDPWEYCGSLSMALFLIIMGVTAALTKKDRML